MPRSSVPLTAIASCNSLRTPSLSFSRDTESPDMLPYMEETIVLPNYCWTLQLATWNLCRCLPFLESWLLHMWSSCVIPYEHGRDNPLTSSWPLPSVLVNGSVSTPTSKRASLDNLHGGFADAGTDQGLCSGFVFVRKRWAFCHIFCRLSSAYASIWEPPPWDKVVERQDPRPLFSGRIIWNA